MLILSENVLLLLGTPNMHLLKKYAPGDLNTHMTLLPLLPLKPQSHVSVVKIVKQRITSTIKEEWTAASSWRTHKERESLDRQTVAYVLGDK